MTEETPLRKAVVEWYQAICAEERKRFAEHIIDKVVNPTLITDTEAPYDRGRFDERMRIQHGIIAALAPKEG